MLEYIEPAARRGLEDKSPYVRRAALMGMLKIYKLLEEMLETSSSEREEEDVRGRMREIKTKLHLSLYDEDP
ncbi:heat repeat-containing protein, partial [Cystoisospora suis]